MKILHFIYDHLNNPWVGGGGAVRSYEIYKRLSEKSHKITVISGKYPGSEDYKINDNFEYRFVGSPKSYVISTLSYAFESMKIMKNLAKDYDVVIEDFAPWNPIFSFLFSKRVVFQIQAREGLHILKKYNIFGLPFFLIERFYPLFFKEILFISEENRRKFGISGEVIPNGITKVSESREEGDYVGFIGRIDIYTKGIDLLIYAMKGTNITLKVAGKGKDTKRLNKLIEENKLAENVHYIGFLTGDMKTQFLKKSKFIVVPSRFEGQGIVVLESAAMGKPLIVSDIPELRYVVENGFGISFRSGDWRDLREKIIYLYKSPELVKQLGENGLNYAKGFLWDKVAQDYEKYLLSRLNRC